MILVDTSIWVEHLRRGAPALVQRLEEGQVCIHPFIVGELACGTLNARRQILDLLRALPQVPVADDEEILMFIEHHRLMGRGIGYVDVHLLASAQITDGTLLWTRDKRLGEIAAEMDIALRAVQ